MNKASQAGYELFAMDELLKMDSPLHKMGAVSKLIVTIAYMLITVSFFKYDFSGLFVMILFPVIGYAVAGIPVRTCFYRLRMVMPLVLIIGIFNPIFDRIVIFKIGSIAIIGGIISMVTLMLKGVLCLMTSFLLVATTSIEEICYALVKLHVPKVITTLILLTYRYISVLIDETDNLITSYHLRASGQRGVEYKAWGTFMGQLLLRSIDRAQELYESMLLRGYNGEIAPMKYEKSKLSPIVAVVLIILFVASRFINVAIFLALFVAR